MKRVGLGIAFAVALWGCSAGEGKCTMVPAVMLRAPAGEAGAR